MEKQPENQRKQMNKIPSIKIDKEKSKLYVALGLILVGCIVIFALLYPGLKRNIRQTQIANAYANEYFSEKVELIPYQTLEEAIKKNQSMLVLFQNGTMKNSDALRKLLNKKEIAELPEMIHVYPLIYIDKKLTEKYQIQSSPVFIYFVDGKEQNRYVFEKKETTIDELLIAVENLSGQPNTMTPPATADTNQEAEDEQTDSPTDESDELNQNDEETEYGE